MRFRFLYAALLLALAPAAAQAQLGSDDAPGPDEPSVVVLSERLGTVIDAHERAYFGLFPGVEGFTEARAFAGEADSVRVVIARAQAADSVVVLARPVARALGRFVETFEQHRTARVHPAWAVVSAYVQGNVRVPYVHSYGRLRAFVENGSYAGHPVYVSDSLVVLSREGRPGFDWRSFEGDGYVVRVDEIERVQLNRGVFASGRAPALAVVAGALLGEAVHLVGSSDPERGNAWERRFTWGAASGMAIGLARNWLLRSRPYEDVAPEVALAAWFTPEARAPELPSDEELARRIEAQPPTPGFYGPSSTFDISMGVATAPAAQSFGFSTTINDETERDVQFVMSSGVIDMAFTYWPRPWLSAGLALTASSDLDLRVARRGEIAYTRPGARVFADLDLLRLYNPYGRFGFALGGGLTYAESVVEAKFPATMGISYDPSSFQERARGIQPFYSATLEAGLMREPAVLRVFVRLLRLGAPSVEVPMVEVRPSYDPEVILYRSEPHTVEFNRHGVLFGIRTAI